MTLKPRDYTVQENIIATCLSELGMRYTQQYPILKYLADFWVPELKLVIEADGVYGHLKKRDEYRDSQLLNKTPIEKVVHIKENTKNKIKEKLCQVLKNY